jgi:putative ATP-dependent endonuclease of OLD family
MAKRAPKPTAETPAPAESEAVAADIKLAKVRWMEVRNFGCIGPQAVRLDFDKIVVLVGQNNMGKSTLLRAYEVIMKEAGNEGTLSIEDFPGLKVPEQPELLPEVVLETELTPEKGSVSSQYLKVTADGTFLLRERWRWSGPSAKPERLGWLWAEDRYEGAPSGFPAKAAA